MLILYIYLVLFSPPQVAYFLNQPWTLFLGPQALACVLGYLEA